MKTEEMTAEIKDLFEYISSSENTFIVPPYQRDYQWDVSDIKKLISDVEENILKCNTNKKYYIGNLLVKRHHDNSITLTDGQQRITTCILISKALLLRIEELDSKNEHIFLREKLKSILFLKEKGNKIKLNNINDVSILKSIILDATPEHTNNNFVKNFEFLKSFFTKLKLEEIIRYAESFQKIVCAIIQLEPDHNEHLPFESINSRGKKLLPSDLIKNYIFFVSEGNEDVSNYYNNIFLKKFINKDVLEFFRLFDCCISNKAPTSKNGTKIYESFKKKYSVFTAENMNEIKKFYSIYKEIQNLCISDPCKYIIKSSFVTYFPWIYSIIDNYKNEKMFEINGTEFKFRITKDLEKELKEQFKIMATYDISRVFGGFHRTESTKSIHKIFNDMKKFLMTQEISIGNASIEEKLSFFTDGGTRKAYDIPRNLNETIFSADVYKEKKRLKVIFWLYELSMRNTEKRSFEKFVEEYSSIEHIFPQGADKKLEWKNNLGDLFDGTKRLCNTIGNLTLLDLHANGYNSNDIFDKKKKVFSDSYLKINNKISDYDEWNFSSIKDRSNKIKDFISKEIIVNLE